MSYRLITDEEYDKYAPELKGSGKVVSDGKKFWYFKTEVNSPDGLHRDLLGFILGSQIANVAEVKVINNQEFDELKALLSITDEFNPMRFSLIRVAGSYSLNELIWKTAEEAVAAELLFSIWTRRRDAHVRNRVYLDGIPIFYDHGVAFLVDHEKHKAHITVFSREASDYGQPSYWRIKLIAGKMTTTQARIVNSADHYVNDLGKFKEALGRMVTLFQNTFKKDLSQEIQRAGFNGSRVDLIKEFLEVNLYCLPKDLEVMSKVFYRTDSI